MFSDGTVLATRCVVWGGGIMAAEIAGRIGLAQGRGGRVDVERDLTVAGHPDVYVVGDIANIPGPDGEPLPQLGSVALQSGVCAAKNIVAELRGQTAQALRYRDKGIMAMIGRGAAIAEVGKRHHEIHGEMPTWPGSACMPPDDRHARQDRGVRRLGLGRVHQDRRPAGARPRRRGRDRLGRRPGGLGFHAGGRARAKRNGCVTERSV